MGGPRSPAGRANLPPGSATLTTVRYAAFALIGLAVLFGLVITQRTLQAASDRDNQPADSNDVVVAIATVGLTILVALSAVVFAVLS